MLSNTVKYRKIINKKRAVNEANVGKILKFFGKKILAALKVFNLLLIGSILTVKSEQLIYFNCKSSKAELYNYLIINTHSGVLNFLPVFFIFPNRLILSYLFAFIR